MNFVSLQKRGARAPGSGKIRVNRIGMVENKGAIGSAALRKKGPKRGVFIAEHTYYGRQRECPPPPLGDLYICRL